MFTNYIGNFFISFSIYVSAINRKSKAFKDHNPDTINRMEDSVFTRIIKGEIPSHKIYEDEKIIAFLDIYPIKEGMTLVVPKVQIDHFTDLPEDIYSELMAVSKKIAIRLKESYPDTRICLILEGFDVPHVHVKLIPVNKAEELKKSADMSAEPDHAKLAEIAERLKL